MFAEAAKIALDVDGAFYGAGFFSHRGFGYDSGLQTGPAPMGIGNVQNLSKRRQMSGERMRDLKNNACFVCHKPGCRPWKHNNEGRTSRKERMFKITTPKYTGVPTMTHGSRKTKWSAKNSSEHSGRT